MVVMTAASVEAQIRLPRPSPASTVKQDIGLTKVKIEYFRPKMKGRKIFGSGEEYVVNYGKLWRTGANNGTKITFGSDVIVGGESVPEGTYLLLTIPNESEWAVILYKNVGLGGNMANFKEEDVLAKYMVTPGKVTEPVETMTFNITDISEYNETANIELTWENTSVKLGMKFDYHELVAKDIEANTKVDTDNYFAAARYYYQTDTNLEKALEFVEMYFAEGGHENEFWNIHFKAQLLHKMGRSKEAIAVAEESLKIAEERENSAYIKFNKDLIASVKKKK